MVLISCFFPDIQATTKQFFSFLRTVSVLSEELAERMKGLGLVMAMAYFFANRNALAKQFFSLTEAARFLGRQSTDYVASNCHL